MSRPVDCPCSHRRRGAAIRSGVVASQSEFIHAWGMKLLTWLLPLLLVSTLPAQLPPVAPSEARQFDFWLGEWEVSGPDGARAGTSRVELMADGWGLLESWTGIEGSAGKSLNAWIPRLKRWRQFWVGQGGALELSGGLNEHGEMVLEGQVIGRDGKERINRITWTPNADGTVRQHWIQSVDGGLTWTTAFDGLYRKKS